MRRNEGKVEMKSERKTRELRLKRRTETQVHRGGSQGQRHPGMEAYVHSRRGGKVRRDRNQTVEQLVILMKRREKRRREEKTLVVVGTTPELGRLRERRAKKPKPSRGGAKGEALVYLTRGWVSGSLTNSGWEGTKPNQGKGVGRRTRGELPGLILFRHPNDHGVGRKEARRCGVPTAGLADSDCQYLERLTYPIPGNDESRAGQRRLRRRVEKLVEETQAQKGRGTQGVGVGRT
jgi:ribosomal protein S2